MKSGFVITWENPRYGHFYWTGESGSRFEAKVYKEREMAQQIFSLNCGSYGLPNYARIISTDELEVRLIMES
jgi:hypothetical protein